MKKIVSITLLVFFLFFKNSFSMSHRPVRRDISNQDFYEILDSVTCTYDPGMVIFFEQNTYLFKKLISLLENVYSYNVRLDPDVLCFCDIGRTNDVTMSISVICNSLDSLDIHLEQTGAVCSKENFSFVKNILLLISRYFFGSDEKNEDILETNNEESGNLDFIIKFKFIPIIII